MSADPVLLTFLVSNEITFYPAVMTSDASGDDVRSYPTGTNYAALVQAKQGDRMTAQGLVESFTDYRVYLSSDIGAESDDKVVWNRGAGKNLFVRGTVNDMGGIAGAYVLLCEERT